MSFIYRNHLTYSIEWRKKRGKKFSLSAASPCLLDGDGEIIGRIESRFFHHFNSRHSTARTHGVRRLSRSPRLARLSPSTTTTTTTTFPVSLSENIHSVHTVSLPFRFQLCQALLTSSSLFFSSIESSSWESLDVVL